MTTFSNKNMTTKVLLSSYTASGAKLIAPSVDLTGLANTAAVITLSFSITRGATSFPCGSYARAKETATDVVLATPTIDVFSLDDGDVLNVYGLSSNAGDTAVGGTVRWADVTGLTAGQVWANAERTITASPVSEANITAIRSGLATEANATTNKTAVLAAIDAKGTGAYAVTITVTDGTNPLENTTVRLVEGVTQHVGTTNASGVTVLPADAATWNVTITKDGYDFEPTTLVVSGDATKTYAMTAVAISPSDDPGLCRCYGTIYDAKNDIVVGGVVTFTLISSPSTPGIYKAGTVTSTSNSNGLITADLIRGAVYKITYDTKDPINISVSDADSMELPSW